MQGWANTKTAEIKLFEELKLEKENLFTTSTLEIKTLKERGLVVFTNLERAYAELSRNALTILSQAEKITILTPMPAKVSTGRMVLIYCKYGDCRNLILIMINYKVHYLLFIDLFVILFTYLFFYLYIYLFIN